jgi:hypothetical protein
LSSVPGQFTQDGDAGKAGAKVIVHVLRYPGAFPFKHELPVKILLKKIRSMQQCYDPLGEKRQNTNILLGIYPFRLFLSTEEESLG